MRKYIFIVALLLGSLCSFAGDWPTELDDADIVFRVIDGKIFSIPTGWWYWGDDAKPLLKITTGGKDDNIPYCFEYDFNDTNLDLRYLRISRSNTSIGTANYANSDSTPQGGVPNPVITPSSYNPDTDDCKKYFATYLNDEFIDWPNPMAVYVPGRNVFSSFLGFTYYNSKLQIRAAIAYESPYSVSETKTITGTGIYMFGTLTNYAVIEVLKYVDYSPKIVKTSGTYFNGANSIVKFDDLIEKAYSGNVFTVTNVTPHSSITVNPSGKFFYIALGDKPINEKAEAKYKLKVENGYATVESELTFTLYSTSLVINSATGGNTDPSPGFVGGVPGETITVTATPDETHSFEKWIGTAITVDNEKTNPLTLTFTDSQMTVTPVYSELPFVQRYTLAFSGSPTRGKIKVGDVTYEGSGSVRIEKGKFAEITAIPNTAYEFSSWSGDISVALAEDDYIQLYMEKDISLAALFKAKPITTGTSTGTSTLGSLATSTAPTTIKYDTSGLDSLISKLAASSASSSSSGTKTGSSSFQEATPFGYGSGTKSSGGSKGSYGSGKTGSSLSNSGDNGNIRDIDELKNSNGYFFKYKAYQNDNGSGTTVDTYYSTDEVEAARNSYVPSNVMSEIYNIISGGE